MFRQHTGATRIGRHDRIRGTLKYTAPPPAPDQAPKELWSPHYEQVHNVYKARWRTHTE